MTPLYFDEKSTKIFQFLFKTDKTIKLYGITGSDNDNDDYFEDYFENEWDSTPAKKDPERLFEAQTFEELMEE